MKTYPIAEVFHSIQGEGHFVGYPMAFVRLGGCSVKACHIRNQCDTDWKSKEVLTVEQIVARCKFTSSGTNIVSITGGEPGDHDLRPLIDALREERFSIHVETSGTKELTGLPVDWLTVSPKIVKYQQRVGHALKIVVLPEWTWETIREADQGTSFFHRYLQPLTGAFGQPVNLPQVVGMINGPQNCNAKWALSTQAHRAWGVR